MRKFSRFIVNNKLVVLIVFVVITLATAIFIPFVRVNYDDTTYLPQKSNVRQSLGEMYNSFGDGGNVTIMFENVSIPQVMRNKNKIMGIKSKRVIDGKMFSKETVNAISQIVWIDSLILAREFGLWQIVQGMGKETDGMVDDPSDDPSEFRKKMVPYTNVEMVTYVWEMGKAFIKGIENNSIALPDISEGFAAFDFDSMRKSMSDLVLSADFKRDVLDEYCSTDAGSLLEEKSFFDRLFKIDPENAGESEFINKIFPLLRAEILGMALTGKIPMPTGEEVEASGFDLTMLEEQIAPFWKPNDRSVTGKPIRGGAALAQVIFNYSDYDDATVNAISQMRKLGIGVRIVGNAAVVSNSIEVVQDLTMLSMILAVIVVVVILLFTTTSFWEPVILILVIGGAILLNMGTNIVMYKTGISYMTQGVASVLQLALTMDYSIYLLNRFKQEKARGLTSNEAMVEALARSLSPVSSASLTTIASFAALCFMSYKLGLDMGFVLMKGIIFSLISVFFFMPPLILLTEKLIYKTAHKTITFSFKRFSKFLIKTRYYLPILIIAVIIPSYIFQSQNKFTYGQEASLEGPKTAITADKAAIRAVFGEQNQAVILLPEDAEFTSQQQKIITKDRDGNEVVKFVSKETLLWQKLNELDIKNDAGLKVALGVQSYQQIVDSGGAGLIPATLKSQMVMVDEFNNLGVRSSSSDHVMIDKSGDVYLIDNGRFQLKRTAEEDQRAKNGEYSYSNPMPEKDRTLYYEYKNIGTEEKPVFKYVLVKKTRDDNNVFENVLDSSSNIQTKDIKATTYRRVILFLPLRQEGEKTTKAIEDIENIITNLYGDQAVKASEGDKRVYTIGQSVAALEIKKLVNKDYNVITIVSLVLVFFILLMTFKSLILPMLMVLIIQGSIYLNMVIPYIQGEQIVFVGYMMVSAILLGATIDYAIVLVSHYLEYREKHNKYDSMQQALASSSRTLITSGGILIFAGLVVNVANKSVSPATAMFGATISRGGITAVALVLVMLPQLLVILDGAIRRTTYKGKLKMIENRLAKPLQQVVEKGKLEVQKREKKRLSAKERERAIIDSLLRGISDKDYDPDQFTFEDYISKDEQDTEEVSAVSKSKEKQKIDMYRMLQDSLAQDGTSKTPDAFFNAGELYEMAKEVKSDTPGAIDLSIPSDTIEKIRELEADEPYLKAPSAFDLEPDFEDELQVYELESSAVAASDEKDEKATSDIATEVKKDKIVDAKDAPIEGATFSEIYDVIAYNKKMVRQSSGTSRAKISKKPKRKNTTAIKPAKSIKAANKKTPPKPKK